MKSKGYLLLLTVLTFPLDPVVMIDVRRRARQ